MQLKVAIVLTILVLLQNDHTLSMHLKGTTCFDTKGLFYSMKVCGSTHNPTRGSMMTQMAFY